MAILILNGESANAMELSSFSRNTTFEGGQMNSYAYMSIIPTASTAATLTTYGLSGVNKLQIKVGNDVIYNLSNITANISSFDESLNGTEMTCSLNIRFN